MKRSLTVASVAALLLSLGLAGCSDNTRRDPEAAKQQLREIDFTLEERAPAPHVTLRRMEMVHDTGTGRPRGVLGPAVDPAGGDRPTVLFFGSFT